MPFKSCLERESIKKGPSGPFFIDCNHSHGVEEEIGEETVPLDQDAGCEGEPDGGNHGGSGEKFLHRKMSEKTTGGKLLVLSEVKRSPCHRFRAACHW